MATCPMAICPTCGHKMIEPKKKETDPRIKQFIEFYHENYISFFRGQTPVLCGGRDAMTIKRILKNWSLDDMKNKLNDYFRCGKSFFIENGFDIPRYERYMAEMGVKNATGLQTGGVRGRTESARDQRVREADEEVRKRLGILQRSAGPSPTIHQGGNERGRTGEVGETIIDNPDMEIETLR